MSVTINQDDLARLSFTLAGIKNGAATVLSRGINKGIDGVGPETKTVVQDTHNIKATVISRQIKKIKSTPSNLSAKATIGDDSYGHGRGTAVIDFKGGRQTKKTGYRVQLKKNKGVVNLKNAFVATMKSGHKGVFVRAGYTNLAVNGAVGSSRFSVSQNRRIATSTTVLKDKTQRKEAIKEVFSTSTVDAISNSGNFKSMQSKVIGRIDRELERQTNLLLSRI